MKESMYNFILDGKSGNKIYYNSRTGSLAEVCPQQDKMFMEFINYGTEIKDKNFMEQLKYCGYLIEDGFNEKNDIHINLLSSRYETSVLSLTITPTMACNFRCVYCFESGHYGQGKMGSEVEEEICKFAEQESGHIEKLVVTWYGGEPLLAMDVIESLTDKLKSICKKSNTEYTASIVTNGYLLDNVMCDRLLECNVEDVQITLDGDCDTHNNRRPLADGKPSFGKIMDNLEEIHGKIDISIRINVDEGNKCKVQDVVNELKARNIYNDVFCYLGLVTPSNGQCNNIACMSAEKYSGFNLQFMLDNKIPLKPLYPRPTGNYCGADYILGYVIDAEGYVYKCWSDVGIQEKRISSIFDLTGKDGNFSDGITDTQSQNVIDGYMLFNPIEDENCSICKYLPLCMGGCPHNRLEGNQMCEQYRYNIDGFLTAYVEKITAEGKGGENI